MDIESFRTYCLSLDGTTEDMKWGNLCFLVENKIYLLLAIDDDCRFAVKCKPEDFEELTDQNGIEQAYHMAKKHWIQVESIHLLPDNKLKSLIVQSRALVIAKLPKKVQSKYMV